MSIQPKGAPEFAKWLKAAMQAKGIKGVRQLAEYSGVSKDTISTTLRGETVPSLKNIRKLAEYFRVDQKVLLALVPDTGYTSEVPSSTSIDQVTGVVLVPVLEQQAGAGEGRALLDYEYINPTITAGHNVIAVRVHGDCMAPKIEDGDTVIIDREKVWENGRVVLARVDDALLIKRAYKQNGHVQLRPDNPDYPEVQARTADILGVVIRVVKPV